MDCHRPNFQSLPGTCSNALDVEAYLRGTRGQRPRAHARSRDASFRQELGGWAWKLKRRPSPPHRRQAARGALAVKPDAAETFWQRFHVNLPVSPKLRSRELV